MFFLQPAKRFTNIVDKATWSVVNASNTFRPASKFRATNDVSADEMGIEHEKNILQTRDIMVVVIAAVMVVMVVIIADDHTTYT